MIAALTQSLSMDKVPFNWFDVAALAVLGFGLFRGRKNGMSKELLPLSLWIALALVCGLGYGMVAQLFANSVGLGVMWSDLLGYLTLALLILILYSTVKKVLAPRLTGSNLFGSGEYYLGMLSGIIRYVCILIFALALINAPYYSTADIQRIKAYNNRWYGGGESGYSGNFIPDMPTVQDNIFKDSFIGPYIKNYLDFLLIETGPSGANKQKSPSAPQKKQPTIHIGK
jgi:Colicin V production protein